MKSWLILLTVSSMFVLSLIVSAGEKVQQLSSASSDKVKAISAPVGRMLALYDAMNEIRQFTEDKWRQIPEGEKISVFQGDAVLKNDRLVVVIRQDGSGAELYTKDGDTWNKRARLIPLDKGEKLKIESLNQ